MAKTIEQKRKAATERMRIWRAKNVEKAREATRKWRRDNRDAAVSNCALWRRSNPEKAKAACDQWRQNNRERVRATARAWRERNADRLNAARRARHADRSFDRRVKEREARAATKARLVAHFGGKCIDCGFDRHLAALEFDHINDDKECNVGTLLNGSSWERLLEEAEKCELVCSNCHKARHIARTDAKYSAAREGAA